MGLLNYVSGEFWDFQTKTPWFLDHRKFPRILMSGPNMTHGYEPYVVVGMVWSSRILPVLVGGMDFGYWNGYDLEV